MHVSYVVCRAEPAQRDANGDRVLTWRRVRPNMDVMYDFADYGNWFQLHALLDFNSDFNRELILDFTRTSTGLRLVNVGTLN
jgi:hypothetical protein